MARRALELADDLTDAKLNLGDYDQDKRHIDFLQARITDAYREHEATERQLKIDEKRIDRLFKNTRIVLASNVGQILQIRCNRVVVNLKPLYKILAGRSEEDVDKAMQEFFAKAIVGLLARANQNFLVSQSKHRQEIFKGVIKDVHKFFFLARKVDRQAAKVAEIDKSIEDKISDLNERRATLKVMGSLIPEVIVVFTVPKASRVVSKTLISGDTARLRLQQGTDQHHVSVVHINTLGDSQTLMTPKVEEWQNCQVYIDDGEVVWERLAKSESTVL